MPVTEALMSNPEHAALADFSAKMQQALVEQAHRDGREASAVVTTALEEHGIGHDAVHPMAAPEQYQLEALTEQDWHDVAAAPEPFVALWSRSNRREIEERNRRRYAGNLGPLASETATMPPTPAEQRWAMEEQSFLQSIPAVHGTSVDTLSKARLNGSFMSNRAVMEPQGGYDFLKPDAGHTYEEDRAVGLDGFVFADYGRPHTSRLGADQPEITVVFKPEAMQQSGTIITRDDYMDTLRGSTGAASVDEMQYNPRTYMGGLKTAEDFQAVAGMEADQMTGASGSWQNGVYIPNKLSLDAIVSGQDGEFDQTGEAHFSTWEVKIPKVGYDMVDRLIFKSEEARDQYLQQNPDNTTPYEVVPDIQEAMRAKQDVFGTKERTQAMLDEKIAADYDRRKAVVESADPSMLQVEFIPLDGAGNKHTNPAWLDTARYASAEDAVKHLRTARKAGNAVMSLFADEDEEIQGLVAEDEPVRVARVVRAGDDAIIENIIEQ